MHFTNILGIDISKNTFDVCCHHNGVVQQFPNNTKGFRSFAGWVRAQLPPTASTLTVMEHTGHYSYQLEQFLSEQNMPYHKHSGLAIRRSMGIVRGKTDAADARLIARFAHQRKEELRPTTPKSGTEIALAQLFSTRTKMVRERTGHKTRLSEMKRNLKKDINKVMVTASQKLITCFSQQIKDLDKAILATIKTDAAFYDNYQLLRSVKGVGPVTAVALIIYTRNFTAFDTWRKFGSWAGVVPFQYQSGTSIHGKTKLSHLANKQMKSLLQAAACIAIQHDKELKTYYERKLKDRKPKMVVFNAVRAKLLARAFAVIKRQKPMTYESKKSNLLLS